MIEQKVVILGGRSTLGQAVAKQLVADDHKVALLSRDRSLADSATVHHESSGDLTDFGLVDDMLAESEEVLGGLTGVVNCCGSMVLKPAHLIDRNTFDATIESNLVTAFAAVRSSARHLKKNGGSCVLISSAAATLGMANHELIACTKAGIEGLIRSAAATYASRGLRFNCLAPGLMDSTMTSHLVSNPGSLSVSEALHPLGRIGSPDEVARAACWLLDPEQSWVTGQTLGVDGGLAHVQPRPKLTRA